jgi:hypothetical protein
MHEHGPGAKVVTAVGQDSGRSAQTQFMIHTTWPGFGPDSEHSGDRSAFGGAPDLGHVCSSCCWQRSVNPRCSPRSPSAPSSGR